MNDRNDQSDRDRDADIWNASAEIEQLIEEQYPADRVDRLRSRIDEEQRIDSLIRHGLVEIERRIAEDYPADRIDQLRRRLRTEAQHGPDATAIPPSATASQLQRAPEVSRRRLMRRFAAPLVAAAVVVLAIVFVTDIRNGPGGVSVGQPQPDSTTVVMTAPPSTGGPVPTTGETPSSDDGSTPTTTAGSSPAGATSDGAVAVADLPISGNDQGVTAQFYFGRRADLLAKLEQQGVTLDVPALTDVDANCAATVVFSGVTGRNAVASVLGFTFDARDASTEQENKPPLSVAADHGLVHQRLLVNFIFYSGTRYDISGRLVVDGKTISTDSVPLTAGSRVLPTTQFVTATTEFVGPDQTSWNLDGAPVNCVSSVAG